MAGDVGVAFCCADFVALVDLAGIVDLLALLDFVGLALFDDLVALGLSRGSLATTDALEAVDGSQQAKLELDKLPRTFCCSRTALKTT